MANNKQIRREIVLTANGKAAEDMMKALSGYSNKLTKELKALAAAGKSDTKEFKTLQAVQKSLQKQMKENISDTQRIDKVMKDLAGSSTKQLRSALNALRREMDRTSEADGKLPKMRKQFQAIQSQIDKNTGSIHKQSSAWQTAVKNLTAYVGLFQAFNYLKTMMTDIIRLNLKYSDQLANIRKVSGLSMKSVEELSDKLAKIDSRTSLEGLTELAYQGSRLGMGEYGVSGLYEFVKAADKVNVALKEDLGDEALSQLSKLVETMGLIKKYGVEEAMDKVGSSIFRLASTSTARGDSIVEFSKRITGLSRVSHIATEELMALASTSDSLMLMPEVASTAFSKFITALQTNFTAIEKDLSLAPDTLKNLLEQKKTMEAIQLVLDRLGKKGGMNALNNMFKDLGSDGDRLKNVIVTMSQNTEILNKHLRVSREAFEEGTAVEFEYNIQQETANALIERANNLWEKTIMTSGNANGVIKEMALSWYELSQMLTTSQAVGMAVNAVVLTLTSSVKLLINLLPTLITMLGTYGLIQTLGSLANALWGAEGAVVKLTKAWQTMNTVTKTSWIGAIIAGATALTLTIIELNKKVDDSAEKMRKMKEMTGNARGELYAAQTELLNYKTAIEKATVGTNEHATAIEQFNKKFGAYLDTLLTEKSTAEDLAKAYQTVNKQLERKLALELKNEMQEELVKPELKKLGQQTVDYDDLANGTGFGSEMLLSFLADNKAKGKKALKGDQLLKAVAEKLGVDTNSYVGNRNILDVVKNYDGTGAPKDVIVENQNGKTSAADVALGTNVRFDKHTYKYSEEQRALFLAAQIINQRTKIDNTEASIDKQLKGFTNVPLGRDEEKNLCPNCGAEMPKGSAVCPKCGFGKLTNTNNNGNGNSTETKEWRQQLKEAQDQANAIIDKIKNYYERQILEVTEKANSLNLDEAQTEALTRPIRAKMNDALAVARKAISNVEQGWDTFKQTMQDDMIEVMGENGLNESQMLLDQIEKADLKALQEKIRTLSKSLNRPESALMDQIWRNATKNAQANADAERKQREEIQKILLEHNYTGIVDNNAKEDFTKIGALLFDVNQLKTWNQGSQEEIKAMLDERDKQIGDMFANARKHVAELLATDVEKEGGKDQFLRLLFGKDMDKSASQLQNILNMNGEKLKAFYYEIIKYTDQYTEAEKRQYEAAKKVANQMWEVNKRNLANQKALRDMQNEANLFGKRTNFASNLGLADLTADPEVELMKLKMQMAEDYYAFVKKNSQNQQLIDDADKARQEAQLAYVNQMATAMKERLSQMKALVNPVIDFGSAMGEALAQMRDDAEGANEAIKSALKSMLKSWGEMLINDLGTQMWKGINDAGAKRAAKKAQPAIDQAQKNADANAVQMNADLLGKDANHPMYVQIVNGQPVDTNGNPVAAPLTPNGTIVTNPDGTQGVTPSNNNNNSDNAQWNPYENNSNSVVFKNAASSFGEGLADAATGNGTMTDAIAGAGVSAFSSALNGTYSIKKKEPKDQHKQDEKDAQKHEQKMVKIKEEGMKDQSKATDKGVSEMTDLTKEGGDEQTALNDAMQKGIVDIADKARTMNLAGQKEANQESLQEDANATKARVNFSIAGAIGKCFEFLGPIAGPIMAGVVMATLNGLLQWALSSWLGGSSKSSSNNAPKTNTKLVSGMLTYDQGNVQDLKPFFDKDGNMYWATEDNDRNHDGINLLTKPTATTINGQPSLVAEQGPELVIGRETTQAIMQNNPALLKALYQYDKHHSGRVAYDAGNLTDGETSGTVAALGTVAMATQGAVTIQRDPEMLALMTALLARLNEPITASINMYGRGGLYEQQKHAQSFMKGK